MSDCCAANLVPGGSFYRSYDEVIYTDKTHPATVADFKLDVYEVTVSRFRRFVAAYPGSLPAAGSGKNPNNASDPGWDPNWTGNLPASQASLSAELAACSSDHTWTSAPGNNESRPINCVTWLEAFAFCIWDGGRLPTDAEWNYAAAGGSEQRVYPWSVPPTSGTIDPSYASYNCTGDGSLGGYCSPLDIITVGSKPLGDGKWGHADLAGNVEEYVLDAYVEPYPTTPCVNCADLTPGLSRRSRGGNYYNNQMSVVVAAHYKSASMYQGGEWYGFRCARNP